MATIKKLFSPQLSTFFLVILCKKSWSNNTESEGRRSFTELGCAIPKNTVFTKRFCLSCLKLQRLSHNFVLVFISSPFGL